MLTLTLSGLKSDFIPPGGKGGGLIEANATGVERGVGGKRRVRVGPKK